MVVEEAVVETVVVEEETLEEVMAAAVVTAMIVDIGVVVMDGMGEVGITVSQGKSESQVNLPK